MSQSPDQDPRRIAIFDTSLRDGEQAPGFSMNTVRKLKLAHALAALKVDVMEVGFAAASPGDAEAIHAIASEIGSAPGAPMLCSLARANERDIDAAERALGPAKNTRLHLFFGTSDLHLAAKHQMEKPEALATIERAIEMGRGRFTEIEFSAEDALRTDPAFLKEVLECAAAAGADVLNVPDTVGYTSPEEIYALFADLTVNVARPDHVVFSTHNHNDLGMAVANSLAAVRGGAGQIECTINGIGERAGNCALEEVVMALKTRPDHYRANTGVDTRQIFAVSRLLGEVTGNAPPRNKAIVGRNAFAHEAGIHQHGVLADRRTYEIMSPEDIGLPSNALVLGKHSGKHALRARLAALGHGDMGDNRFEKLYADFKRLADTRREVTDNDLCDLIAEDGRGHTWELVRVEMRTGTKAKERPTAKVTLDHTTRGRLTTIGHGTGPFEALTDAFCVAAEVKEGMLESIDAHQLSREMEIEVGLTVDGVSITGRSQHTDVVIAAAEALLAAFNNHARAQETSRLANAA
ncbi:MAG: 2-isopropylmalate synthase [Erythrobacter sp.]|nr:2-isopropylmalate synthase [Erythrobacter sp.]NCQ63121.1 2-isopropylmalate synthase [Alphaproteobacteria bacterium]